MLVTLHTWRTVLWKIYRRNGSKEQRYSDCNLMYCNALYGQWTLWQNSTKDKWPWKLKTSEKFDLTMNVCEEVKIWLRITIPVQSHVTSMARCKGLHNKPFVNHLISILCKKNINGVHFRSWAGAPKYAGQLILEITPFLLLKGMSQQRSCRIHTHSKQLMWCSFSFLPNCDRDLDASPRPNTYTGAVKYSHYTRFLCSLERGDHDNKAVEIICEVNSSTSRKHIKEEIFTSSTAFRNSNADEARVLKLSRMQATLASVHSTLVLNLPSAACSAERNGKRKMVIFSLAHDTSWVICNGRNWSENLWAKSVPGTCNIMMSWYRSDYQRPHIAASVNSWLI